MHLVVDNGNFNGYISYINKKTYLDNKMVKLKKTEVKQYNGSQWVYEWTVKGHEHIRVRHNGNWIAMDTTEYAIIEGKKIYKRIAKAKTRNELANLIVVG